MTPKLIGKFRKPKEGEIIMTENGSARIVRVLLYADVIEEMKQDGASDDEIRRFDMRVKHFLGKENRYFECELLYIDRGIVRIDWSEYMALKRKKPG